MKSHILLKSVRTAGVALLLGLTFQLHAQESDPGSTMSPESQKAYEELSEMSLEELLNLKITVASKKAEKISDAAGVISVITREELESFGGITLRDILERVPSLIGSASAFTERYGLSSRGDRTKINSGHILLLINGRPSREIVEGGISSEMYASFPINIIERIEVIRGPGSVLYGSNAFSAVINIITETAEENNVAVSALTGNGGAVGANGEGKFKVGDLQVSLAGRYMKKADWKTSYKTMMYDFMTNTFYPVEAMVTIPDESKAAYVDAKYKGLSFMASHNDYKTAYFQSGGFINTWKKDFANLGYDLKVNDNWEMNFNGTYNYAGLDSDTVPGIVRKSHDLVAEWTNHITITENFSVVAGGLYNKVMGSEVAQILGESVTVSDKSRENIALYSQADFWLLENLKLIGGFQANKVADFDLDIVPRGGVVWYPFPRINVKGLYSQAYRASSVDEFGMNYPTGLKGDKNLKPEKVSTIDLGVNYFGEKVQYGVNYFHSKMNNIIAPGYIVDPNDPFILNMVYMNYGETTFKGLEAEGKFYLARNLFLTGSLLYQENKSDTVSNVTPVANFSAKGGLSYKWKKGITVSLFNNYQGKLDEKFSENAFNANPKPGSYNTLDLYCSVDLVKLFKMNINQGISVFFQGNNMLDEEVWISDTGSLFVGPSLPANPGRTIYAGINFSLK